MLATRSDNLTIADNHRIPKCAQANLEAALPQHRPKVAVRSNQEEFAPNLASRVVGVLLLPGFSNLELHAVVEALMLANKEVDCGYYAVRFVGPNAQDRVVGSHGMPVATTVPFNVAESLDYVVVCGGQSIAPSLERRIECWLRKLDRHGTVIAALSVGTLLLARVGLLNGVRCTAHRNLLPSLREICIDSIVTAKFVEQDRRRLTCAGGISAIDLALEFVEMDLGSRISCKVADQLVHDRIRNGDRQSLPTRHRYGVTHPQLVCSIELMQNHIEDTLTIQDLADLSGASKRHLERCFSKHLNSTPSRFYRNLRLQRARHLLRYTSLSVLEISILCGFTSHSHFSKVYARTFECAPSKDRQHFPGGGGPVRPATPSHRTWTP